MRLINKIIHPLAIALAVFLGIVIASFIVIKPILRGELNRALSLDGQDQNGQTVKLSLTEAITGIDLQNRIYLTELAKFIDLKCSEKNQSPAVNETPSGAASE